MHDQPEKYFFGRFTSSTTLQITDDTVQNG